MLCWVILGTGAVIVIAYGAIRVLQYLSEREDDEEDEPTDL